MVKFSDIKPFTRSAPYVIDYPWKYMVDKIENWQRDQESAGESFDLNPDFQRGHVWTENQQSRYVEYILRGGKSSRDIYFNHPGWQGSYKGAMVLVDGKQRLEAVLKFLRDELVIFNEFKRSDFEGSIPSDASFRIHVNDLPTRADVLQWYIDLNRGGVAHTDEEITKVQILLMAENAKK